MNDTCTSEGIIYARYSSYAQRDVSSSIDSLKQQQSESQQEIDRLRHLLQTNAEASSKERAALSSATGKKNRLETSISKYRS